MQDHFEQIDFNDILLHQGLFYFLEVRELHSLHIYIYIFCVFLKVFVHSYMISSILI